MNQILVSKKLYVTPELKKKRDRFKLYFTISIFCICLLTSYYIYAEWDRSKSEQVSQKILESIELKTEEDDTVVDKEKSIIVVDLDVDEDEEAISVDEVLKKQNSKNTNKNNQKLQVYKFKEGTSYTTDAILKIEKINLNYPVLSDTSEDLLKISLNKLWGPNPNEVGNYCIVGHNYKNNKMFGALNKVGLGDIIELTDLDNNTIKYEVYNKFVVEPSDVSCTSQVTNGKKEVTLITCTNYGTQRLIIKAREQKKD